MRLCLPTPAPSFFTPVKLQVWWTDFTSPSPPYQPSIHPTPTPPPPPTPPPLPLSLHSLFSLERARGDEWSRARESTAIVCQSQCVSWSLPFLVISSLRAAPPYLPQQMHPVCSQPARPWAWAVHTHTHTQSNYSPFLSHPANTTRHTNHTINYYVTVQFSHRDPRMGEMLLQGISCSVIADNVHFNTPRVIHTKLSSPNNPGSP